MEIEILKEKLDYLTKINIPLFFISTYNNIGLDELNKCIFKKIVAFGGPSGVGKSSILNLLQNEEELIVGETSKRLRAGKHTTRDSKLIPSNCQGYVIDTPGFSSIELPPIKDSAELITLFNEFQIEGDKYCKFLDCHHISEPECLIKKMVEENKISTIRYEFYKKVYDKLKNERWNNYEKY